MDAIDLSSRFSPFIRCMECNTELAPAGRNKVQRRVPPDTLNVFTQFSQCNSCERIYWQGSHYRRMLRFMAETFGYDGARTTAH